MPPPSTPKPGTPLEVLLAFLRLGCLSFGGPIAHLGYFHAEFVARRRWCSAQTYAEIVALAQSLPGPASSQVAFALGLLRARWLGALAAWTGFTLPSAILLVAFALTQTPSHLAGPLNPVLLHGLQLVAVPIVAQAVLSMQRSLAPDASRLTLAIASVLIATFAPPRISTILPIVLGALIGAALLSRAAPPPQSLDLPIPVTRTQGLAATIAFLLLLVPLSHSHPLAVFNAFYRTGALVFGGGHVVLPLLEHAVVDPGWIPQSTFLAGYGATQAIPGPLFTFAAFLGANIGAAGANSPDSAYTYAALALIAIFLPGMLLLTAALPFWATLRTRPRLQAALRGVNASVVGVLFAAWLHPVSTTAIHSPADVLIAAGAFLALVHLQAPPWAIVLATVALAMLTHTATVTA
jgi:chromate transporter